MTKIAYYLHAGSLNHGCEAIVRSTVQIINGALPECEHNLYSGDTAADEKFLSDTVNSISLQDSSFNNKKLKSGSADYFKLKFLSCLSKTMADDFYYYTLYENAPLLDNDLFVSIGGDVYCYGENSHISSLNKRIRERGKKSVLWGCSIGENDMNKQKLKDLRGYDLITVRESITYELLSGLLGKEKVKLHCDPAFSLNTQYLPLPEGFKEGNTIGINISPLISKYETEATRGIGVQSVRGLIDYIIGNTDSAVALIPHVMQAGNNDLELLKQIYDEYASTGKVVLIDAADMNAEQIKGYIARCRLFVGARTHATIAAYSSLVPTLVIGYSVKSSGIARDLFGTEDGLVLPIQKMTDKTMLTECFTALMKNEDKYREQLVKVIPGCIDSAKSAGSEISRLY